jgi:hypothetical protein
MPEKMAIYMEADAATKICPLSFAIVETENRHGGPWMCSASRCMAWRWRGTHINDPAGGTDVERFGADACADADRIAANGPFKIVPTKGANAQGSEG